jgi:hypothetical protein
MCFNMQIKILRCWHAHLRKLRHVRKNLRLRWVWENFILVARLGEKNSNFLRNLSVGGPRPGILHCGYETTNRFLLLVTRLILSSVRPSLRNCLFAVMRPTHSKHRNSNFLWLLWDWFFFFFEPRYKDPKCPLKTLKY